MSVWLWLLIGLGAAGALFAIIGSLQTLTAAIRLGKRLSAMRESPFVTLLDALQIQVDRLARTASDAQELERRTKTALECLRAGVQASGIYAIRDSWRSFAAELHAMAEELS